MHDEPALRPATPFGSRSRRMRFAPCEVLPATPARQNKLEPLSWRGGWGEPSNMPEPPLGGGAGESCVKSCRPKDG
jgi:hypothetical protein